MSRWRLAVALLAAVLAWPVAAETLLVVRKSDDAVDFMDPGSGLRLASVALGYAPHEVSVAPDGRRAAVTNYGTRDRPGTTISIVDLDRCALPLAIDSPPAGTSYVFNRGGQEIDVSHLLCLHDAAGPCANAVKDAQRTKTSEQTRRVLAVLWGSSRCGTGHVAAAGRWLAQLMERLGARVQMVKCGQE